jgi:hypothetical protein
MKGSITIFFVIAAVAVHAQNGDMTSQSADLYLDYSFMYENNATPVIVWESPGVQHEVVQDRRYAMSVQINSSSELRDINVWLNEQNLNTQRGFKVVPVKDVYAHTRRIESEVLLQPGENIITVTAGNMIGAKSSSSRIISLELDEIAEKAVNRTDYAVLFATNEYDYWNNLTNPMIDAQMIADELKSAYGYQVEIVHNPSGETVLQTLRKYSMKQYQPNDQLFLFFAGHGHFDEVFNQGYLVCKDSRMDDESKRSYISFSNLREVVNGIPSNHIFLAIDACFGGVFDPHIKDAIHRGGDDLYRETGRYEYIVRKLKFRTRQYLTSGGKEYVPDGKPGSHSPFVRKFLEALRSYGGDDRILTLGELKTYLEKVTPEPRYGEFGSNEPGSDFIFIAR